MDKKSCLNCSRMFELNLPSYSGTCKHKEVITRGDEEEIAEGCNHYQINGTKMGKSRDSQA